MPLRGRSGPQRRPLRVRVREPGGGGSGGSRLSNRAVSPCRQDPNGWQELRLVPGGVLSAPPPPAKPLRHPDTAGEQRRPRQPFRAGQRMLAGARGVPTAEGRRPRARDRAAGAARQAAQLVWSGPWPNTRAALGAPMYPDPSCPDGGVALKGQETKPPWILAMRNSSTRYMLCVLSSFLFIALFPRNYQFETRQHHKTQRQPEADSILGKYRKD